MTRAILIVLDSVGCGGARDAADYGDEGADTLGHIAQALALHLPNLDRLGLGLAMHASTGRKPPGFACGAPAGQWGYAVETSRGKDTPSGHWEIAGTPVDFAWGYFAKGAPAFAPEFTRELIARGQLNGILGDCHASGTQIIERFGEAHLATLKPICYTSADSVLQIAAHEEAFGLDRLYELCRVARVLCDPLNIGRVIARPFLGERPGAFQRTANRKDFSIPPLPGNLLQRAAQAGRQMVSIGKIGDIFAHRDTGLELKGKSNDEHVDLLLRALQETADGGLIFANLVDFDTEYGHRRDIKGYAACLQQFDRRLPEIQAALRPGDLCILTADHGNDPSWRGYDHTREHVPVLAFGDVTPGPIGERTTFADIAETIAKRLHLPQGAHGTSWL